LSKLSRLRLPRPARILPVVTLCCLVSGPPAAQAAGTASISGVAFKDTNRNAMHDAGESVLTGDVIYVSDAFGAPVTRAAVDASGAYRITGLTPGTYRVRYGTVDWWDLWQDWAPSTLPTEVPEARVDLSDTAVVDFGWRPIVRSTTQGSPISSYVGPNGLRVESYDDVVPAKRVYDAVMETSLHGGETAYTTIRFDLEPSNLCTASVVSDATGYHDFQANCYVAYLSWLNAGDNGLHHEYGHAWSLYQTYMMQQDDALTGYLEARGVLGDPRLYSSSSWNPREMVAEDYRQLFGTANAASGAQDNQDVPRAASVAGLREYLSGPFMEPRSSSPAPPASPAPSIHVSSLEAKAAKISKRWRATATAGVRGADGAAVAGAVVSLRWSDSTGAGGSPSCTTDAAGVCSLSIDPPAKATSVSFSVASLAKTGWDYASADNTAPASVVVSKPR
jgi:hypothetical protein